MSGTKNRIKPGLPFVAGGKFWAVQPSNDFPTAFQEGQSYAAAYLRHIRGDVAASPMLGSIVLHMRESKSQGHIVGFFDVIDQHLRATIESPDIEMLFQL